MWKRGIASTLLVGLLLAALPGTGIVQAKKPPKPPPEPEADPAIAFGKTVSKGRNYSTYTMVMNADGTNQDVVVEGASGSVAWTPEDPPRLLYWVGYTLYVIDIDGTNSTLVKDIGAGSKLVACCPVQTNGTYRIAIKKGAGLGTPETWIVNLDGTGLTAITQTEDIYEEGATWSPDGTKLAIRIYDVNQPNSQDLWAIYDFTAAEGERYTFYQHVGGMAGKTVRYPSWSKTGTEIVWSVYDANTGDSDLWIVDVSDLENPVPTQLTNTPNVYESRGSWSPDDSKIVFRVRNSGKKGFTYDYDVIEATNSNRETIAEDVGYSASSPAWRW